MNLLKNFLQEDRVQKALEADDLNMVYQLYHECFGRRAAYTPLTEFLLSYNINPLDYMDFIPSYFLYDSDITTLKIPTTIKGIDSFSICRCGELLSIEMPSSITFIGTNAIVGSPNLIIKCEKYSYAHRWCLDTAKKFEIIN